MIPSFRRPVFLPSVLLGLLLPPLGGCQDQTPLALEPSFSTMPGEEDPGPGARPVPFRGTLMITSEVPDPTPRPGCIFSSRTELVGELTHLGHFRGVGTVCVRTMDVGVLDPPSNPGGGDPPYVVSEFTVEQDYTAPDGDVLQISGLGLLVRSLTDGSSGFTGHGIVEGGSGRFHGATGAFDVLGVGGVVTYDGWISYRARNAG